MIVFPRKYMSRRHMLKGLLGSAAVGVGLPTLDAMLNANGTALAQGAPIPTRFGLWFWGNGIRRQHWTPDQTGVDWMPKAELAPLVSAGLKNDISLVTGLEIKTATHPHHSGMTGILTGAHYHQVGTTRDTIVSTFAYPSVDQLAAAHFEGQTPFRSIELAVCRFRGTDEGTTFQHLSHNGVNDPNPSQYNPVTAYERLFGVGPSNAEIDFARRSVLDAVVGQIRDIQNTVGQRDRQRLERHFESIRTLEQRLASGQAICDRPGEVDQYPDVDGREQIQEKNRAMSEIMAYALACDLTRAFSVMFSSAGSGVVIWQAGAQNSLHQICHDEAVPQPIVHAAVTFIMGELTTFLSTLKSLPEGNGTLLDNCSILCTTELSEGNTHSNDEFPVIIAGRGGGRLRPGTHVRRPRENASKAGLTALRGAGIPMDNFGHGPGLVEDSLAEIEA
jgi:hypothetical protein